MSRPIMFLVLFAGWVTGAAYALTITASPVVIKAEVPPGSSTHQVFTISNGSDQSLHFEAEVYDLGLDEAGNQARFAPGSLPETMAGWLSLQPAQFVVPAGGEQKVGLVISVPADASGGRQAAIVFRTTGGMRDTSGKEVRVGAGIAAKIFHATPGSIFRAVEVIELHVHPPSAYELAKAQFVLRNTGNAFLSVSAEMAILDEAQNLVGRGTSAPSSILIPGQSTPLIVEWGGELTAGNYSTLTTILYDGGSVVVENTFQVDGTSQATHATGGTED